MGPRAACVMRRSRATCKSAPRQHGWVAFLLLCRAWPNHDKCLRQTVTGVAIFQTPTVPSTPTDEADRIQQRKISIFSWMTSRQMGQVLNCEIAEQKLQVELCLQGMHTMLARLSRHTTQVPADLGCTTCF